jgi:hypothetical protein
MLKTNLQYTYTIPTMKHNMFKPLGIICDFISTNASIIKMILKKEYMKNFSVIPKKNNNAIKTSGVIKASFVLNLMSFFIFLSNIFSSLLKRLIKAAIIGDTPIPNNAVIIFIIIMFILLSYFLFESI